MPVEGSYIIPDREGLEASVVLPGDQHVPCVGLELDGADAPPPEQLAAEDASTSAREKCQLIQLFLLAFIAFTRRNVTVTSNPQARAQSSRSRTLRLPLPLSTRLA